MYWLLFGRREGCRRDRQPNPVRRSLEMKVAILTSGSRKFYISASRQSPVGMPSEVAQVRMTLHSFLWDVWLLVRFWTSDQRPIDLHCHCPGSQSQLLLKNALVALVSDHVMRRAGRGAIHTLVLKVYRRQLCFDDFIIFFQGACGSKIRRNIHI